MRFDRYTVLIGIDPGVNTGLCVINREAKTMDIKTTDILAAMDTVLREAEHQKTETFIRFEDARLRTWFGTKGAEALQGAGSIKRDCGIWEDFFIRHGLRFEAVPPRSNKTKMNPDSFKKMTGHTGRTSEHGRDAAMLVFGL